MTTSTMTIAFKPAPPIADSPLGVVDQLLRDSGTFLEQIDQEADTVRVAKTLLLTIVVTTGAFGASIGAYRLGLQPLFAALKLPLVVLLTAGLTAPAFTALSYSGGPVLPRLRRDLLLVLASIALTGLVLAALAPVVMLGVMLDVSYHGLVLLVVGCCALGGGAGLVLFLRGVSRRDGRGSWAALLATLALFALVGSQMAWTFRPFVARPRADIAFVRPIEGSFLDAVGTSARSARGVYTRDYAPLPQQAR